MGRSCVKSKLTKKDFEDSIMKSKGVIVKAARRLHLSRTYFHAKVTEFGLRDLLNEVREDYSEDMVDLSEDFNEWALKNKVEMPAIAQRSAFYILDNLGKKYGYNTKESNDNPTPRDEFIEMEIESIKKDHQILEKDKQIEKLTNELKHKTNI